MKLTQNQINEIESCYAQMQKGVSDPKAVNACFHYITGTHQCFGGFKAKELRIVRFVMNGLRQAKQELAENPIQDDSQTILTKVDKDVEPNFKGVKTPSAKSEDMPPEDQSHQESLSQKNEDGDSQEVIEEADGSQSHQEDVIQHEDVSASESISPQNGKIDNQDLTEDEAAYLMMGKKYEDSEDPNEKRSLKQKMRHLEKRIKNQ